MKEKNLNEKKSSSGRMNLRFNKITTEETIELLADKYSMTKNKVANMALELGLTRLIVELAEPHNFNKNSNQIDDDILNKILKNTKGIRIEQIETLGSLYIIEKLIASIYNMTIIHLAATGVELPKHIDLTRLPNEFEVMKQKIIKSLNE